MNVKPEDNSFSALVDYLDQKFGHTYEDVPKELSDLRPNEKAIELLYKEYYEK